MQLPTNVSKPHPHGKVVLVWYQWNMNMRSWALVEAQWGLLISIHVTNSSLIQQIHFFFKALDTADKFNWTSVQLVLWHFLVRSGEVTELCLNLKLYLRLIYKLYSLPGPHCLLWTSVWSNKSLKWFWFEIWYRWILQDWVYLAFLQSQHQNDNYLGLLCVSYVVYVFKFI